MLNQEENIINNFLEDKNDYKEQNSKAWHEWRKKHIGASEVPAIMGTSDFSNAYQYWLEKTGQVEKFKGNFATQRGQSLEPRILELYYDKTGFKGASKVVEYEAWPVLSASLDGFVDDQSIVVEVKAPSKDKHEQALQGIVPETYRDQVQTQLLVTGAKKAHYVSYHTGFGAEKEIAIVEVLPDEKRQHEILAKCQAMWVHIENMTPPEGVCVQEELIHLFEERDEIEAQIKALESRSKAITDEIRASMKADKVLAGNFIASWSTRKGTVDYSAIPELKTVDLNKYRKQDSRVLTIKNKKEKR